VTNYYNQSEDTLKASWGGFFRKSGHPKKIPKNWGGTHANIGRWQSERGERDGGRREFRQLQKSVGGHDQKESAKPSKMWEKKK